MAPIASNRQLRCCLFLLCLLACLFVVRAVTAAERTCSRGSCRQHGRQPAAVRARTIRPWLEKNCLECHGGAKVKSEFNLSTRELLLKGGDKGVDVLPGQERIARSSSTFVTKRSRLCRPKNRRLPADIAAAVTRWIESRRRLRPAARRRHNGEKTADGDGQRQGILGVSAASADGAARGEGQSARLRTPIDRFLLAKMEMRGVMPAVEADRRTLVRRLYFDLVGLPPKPEEVETVVAAPDFEQAWAKLVDRLLASPQYGERWARHWLDPAASPKATASNTTRLVPLPTITAISSSAPSTATCPTINSCGGRLPVTKLSPNDPDALAATGFLGAGVFPTQITTSEAERVRYDALDDMLATTGYTMLALTVACARCHDHKFDPIPTRDYYRMLAAFTTTVRSEIEWDFGDRSEPVKQQKKSARVKMQICTRRAQADASAYGRCFYPRLLPADVLSQSAAMSTRKTA